MKSKSDPNDLINDAAGSDSYIQYHGDGSSASGWPSMDDWVSFQHMQVPSMQLQILDVVAEPARIMSSAKGYSSSSRIEVNSEPQV